LSLHDVPAVYGSRGAHRRRAMRALEVAGRAEQFDLALLGKPGAEALRVVRAEAQSPRSAGVALGDGHDDPPEGMHAEGVAADPLRLQDPVEAGLGELLIELGRVLAEPFRFGRLVADRRDERLGAGHNLLRRQVWLRRRDVMRSWKGLL